MPANAQSSGEMASYAYLSIEPNPVGVGQTTYVAMWVDFPMPGATEANSIRRHDYKLTITAPDGYNRNQRHGQKLKTQQVSNQLHSHQTKLETTPSSLNIQTKTTHGPRQGGSASYVWRHGS